MSKNEIIEAHYDENGIWRTPGDAARRAQSQSQKPERNYIAFYADIPHKEIDVVLDDIKEYYKNTKSYLIGLEYAEAREHYHFVIDFTEKEYAAYVKRVLKGKFHLSGRRNKKGHTGQFGKVSKIRNIEAMCSYTLKDLDYRTNFDAAYIETLVKKSYPKPENDKDLMTECMEYIKTHIHALDDCDRDSPMSIACIVMRFMKSKDRDMVQSTIRRFTIRYLTYYENVGEERLFRILFPHGI